MTLAQQTGEQAHNVQQAKEAYRAQHFQLLAPQPRMSTGLDEATRTAHALLLPPRSTAGHAWHAMSVAAQQVAQSLPVNLDAMDSPPIPTVTSLGLSDAVSQKLYEEYQRTLQETDDAKKTGSRSPFQHFRPTRVRRSNSTKVNVDLTSGNNWTSAVTEKIQQATAKPEKLENHDTKPTAWFRPRAAQNSAEGL